MQALGRRRRRRAGRDARQRHHVDRDHGRHRQRNRRRRNRGVRRGRRIGGSHHRRRGRRRGRQRRQRGRQIGFGGLNRRQFRLAVMLRVGFGDGGRRGLGARLGLGFRCRCRLRFRRHSRLRLRLGLDRRRGLRFWLCGLGGLRLRRGFDPKIAVWLGGRDGLRIEIGHNVRLCRGQRRHGNRQRVRRHRPFDRVLLARGSKRGDRLFGGKPGLRRRDDGSTAGIASRPAGALARTIGLSRGIGAVACAESEGGSVDGVGMNEILRISERMRSGSSTTRLGNSTMRALESCEEFDRGVDRADVGHVEHAERHRAGRKNDAEAFEAAKNLFFDRQFERIEIDVVLWSNATLPKSPDNFLLSSGELIGRSNACVVC